VWFPPIAMKTADRIPQRKLAGMRVPVLHAGRWNLEIACHGLLNQRERISAYRSRLHIVAHNMIYIKYQNP
jgi:hypothetical protein